MCNFVGRNAKRWRLVSQAEGIRAESAVAAVASHTTQVSRSRKNLSGPGKTLDPLIVSGVVPVRDSEARLVGRGLGRRDQRNASSPDVACVRCTSEARGKEVRCRKGTHPRRSACCCGESGHVQVSSPSETEAVESCLPVDNVRHAL